MGASSARFHGGIVQSTRNSGVLDVIATFDPRFRRGRHQARIVDNLAPQSVSSDGRWLLAMARAGPDGMNVLRIDLEAGDRELQLFIAGPANQV